MVTITLMFKKMSRDFLNPEWRLLQVAVRNRPGNDPFGGLFADMNRMMGGMTSMMGNMQRQMVCLMFREHFWTSYSFVKVDWTLREDPSTRFPPFYYC